MFDNLFLILAEADPDRVGIAIVGVISSIGIWFLILLFIRWFFKINVMVKNQETIIRELQSLDMPRNEKIRCSCCRQIILSTETPCVYNEQIVCSSCDASLRASWWDNPGASSAEEIIKSNPKFPTG